MRFKRPPRPAEPVYSIGDPPPDWVYETADAEVGLFFEGWYHALEDCVGDALDPEKTVLATEVIGEGANRTLREKLQYRCPCGAEMTVIETTYDPDFPDDAWGPGESSDGSGIYVEPF